MFMQEVYEPREDSELIRRHICNYAKGKVLDMGTGSGILAIEAARCPLVTSVYAFDINTNAVEFVKDSIEGLSLNIQPIVSNLFSYLKENNKKIIFDTIFFNPPYLPYDVNEPESIRDYTTGGKKGYEIIESFFCDLSKFLAPEGKVLLIFSSLTNQEKVHDIIQNYGFNYKMIDSMSFFQEQLFLYLIEKTDFLIKLKKKGITSLIKINKGSRGLIFKGVYKKKDIAVKVKNPQSKATGRIEHEVSMLKILNKHDIGPKLIFSEDILFCYEYVKGLFIEDFIKKSNKKDIVNIFIKILKQCYRMDNLKITKEEMHIPYKHIIINEKNMNVVMLDFERAHFTNNPKNVSQFIQYIVSGRMKHMLKEKIKYSTPILRDAVKKYKEDISDKNFNQVLLVIKNA